jgi:hypothetical protein
VLLFVLGVLLIAGASKRLIVYHAVTLVDVQLVRIAPDGTRASLSTPPALRSRGGLLPPRALLTRLRGAIRGYMRDAAPLASAPVGTRYEWVVYYDSNTMTLGRRHTIVFTRRGGDG